MVNFNIIENNDSQYYESIYESFKTDFLNPMITVNELKEKYDLSRTQYNHLREKVLNETGLDMKPAHISRKRITSNMHIIKYTSGRYAVIKIIDGCKKNFGLYPDYNTAILVRDELIKSNWDSSVALYLKKTYGVGRYRPSATKAGKVYDEFEELFLKGVLMKEIIHKLKLNQYQYDYLARKVRDKYGLLSKKNIKNLRINIGEI